MRFCDACGTVIPAQSSFCPTCGANTAVARRAAEGEVVTAGASAVQEWIGVPWGPRRAFAVFLVSQVVYIVGAIVLLLIFPTLRGHPLLGNVVLYQCLALGVALGTVWLIVGRYDVKAATFGFRPLPWKTMLRVAAGVIPLLVVVGLLTALLNKVLPGAPIQGNVKETFPVAGGPSIGTKWLAFLWAAVEAPVVEEILFRGVLFQALRDYFGQYMASVWSVLLSAGASGLVFGAAHLEPHTLPLLVFMGIALAYIFQSTRSIYASMMVHGLLNGLALAATLL
jgi:membrane protease YdiL (CAAX protease family)